MSNAVTAIVIHADGNAETIEVVADLEALGEIVGGILEAIVPQVDTGYRWTAYLNEEGKLEGLPHNFVADVIATMLGWAGRVGGDFLVGPVVFLGPIDAEGDDTSIQDNVVEAILDYYRANGEVVTT